MPAPEVFDSATVVIGLDDVTKIDALSHRVAETKVGPISGRQQEIPFVLALPEPLPRTASYELSAEIRRAGGNAIRPGDFLSIVSHPWSLGDDRHEVIHVEKI
jgi:hypothetical protein